MSDGTGKLMGKGVDNLASMEGAALPAVIEVSSSSKKIADSLQKYVHDSMSKKMKSEK